jgi:uncharacterized protein YecE (DUF72 family)
MVSEYYTIQKSRGAAVRIGTSGWHYRHWKPVFYPADLAVRAFLGYYAARFDTVEINNSFYRLPERATLRAWRATVPAGFTFAVKASRYITEAKKLKDPAPGLARLFERIDALGDKLGPLLFQLPPHWRLNLERLAAFLAALPKRYRAVLEFRDPSWFDDRVYDLLARHRAAFCMHDHAGAVTPRERTADIAYIRFHGPASYPARQLASWAADIRRWAAGGTTVYAYFNNDFAGFAVRNAATLKSLIPETEAS